MSVLREGDSGLGVPVPEKSEARELSSAEIEAYRRADEEELRRRLDELLEAADPGALGFRVPPALRSLATLLVLLAISVLALLVLGQAASIMSGLKDLPREAQIAMIAAGGVVGLLILIVSIRLLALYFRVQRSERIKVRVLDELATRGRLQAIAVKRADEARKQLVDYLERFPLDDRRPLIVAGLREEELAKLRSARAQLVESTSGAPTEWLKRFLSDFQSLLDEAAARRARAYATRAGLATAGSPNSFFDTLLVLYLSLAMIGDLVRIYNLRADGLSSMVILGKVIGLAYLAGPIHEGAHKASDLLVGSVMGEGSSTLARGVVGFLSAKAAEGTANGFLMMRLATATRRLLRPVHPGK